MGQGVEDRADSSALFRQEAVGAARDRLGSPVRSVGLASWVLTTFLIAVFAAVLTFLIVGQYTRKETVVGILEPSAGALRITAVRAGIISNVSVREGQFVERGESLISLSMDPTIAGGRRLGEVLTETGVDQAAALSRQAIARRQLIARQRDELAVRREAIVDQQHRLADEVLLQEERVRLTQQTADAAKKLFDQQLLPAIQYRQREEALISSRQGLSSVKRELARMISEERQVSAQERRLLAEAEEASASIDASRAQLAERRATTVAETSIILTAQEPGQVTALQARMGAPTVPGATLAILLPRGVKLQAVLWAPSRAVGFIRPGDRVRVMYDAFPYQRFGVGKGKVLEIARAPTSPTDLPIPIETKESLYRVVVVLDQQSVAGYGKDWPLAPGMRLNADVVLERQSLLVWLFDKVRAVRARSRPV